MEEMATAKETKVFVIGISGVTSGGKTSLCAKLVKAFEPNASTLNMDAYFWPEDSPNHILLPEFNGHANWEAPESVDFQTLYSDVIKWKEEASKKQGLSILLIDGIIVYNYKPLVPLFDRKYFFTLDEETSRERRKLRHYVPPDPPGYYEGIVWPMYLQNKKDLDYIKDIVYLDGTKSPEDIFNFVKTDLENFIEGKK